MADRAICSVEGCDKGGKLARGWCTRHYSAWLRNGDPTYRAKMGPKGRPANSLMPWIESRVRWSGDECLIWPFTRTLGGYGIVHINRRRERASRVMCSLAHGAPPTLKHEAAHSCGNGHGGCVNPRHLRWATRKENAADSVGHGTWNHGEKVPQAILTEDQVREIRRLKGSMLQREIAEKFGVTRAAVGLIHRRKNWAWLA